MDASPRKVEHAKAPAASADPDADLALVKRLRSTARRMGLCDPDINDAADAIERLLRERDGLANALKLHAGACLSLDNEVTMWKDAAAEAEKQLDAAFRERDEARRQLSLRIGD